MQREKQRIRKQIWEKMEKYEIATSPRPCYGKIPNFIGSLNAARKITRLEVFRKARIVYSTPDLPQKPIREEALRRRKIVMMATPGLRRGFILLRPDRIPPNRVSYATTVRGSLAYGERIAIPEGMKVDIFVIGSVAVTEKGARLGKGGGIYDLEYAILRELHVLDRETPIATTVHDIQVVNEEIPMSPYDVPVDYVATPSRLIYTHTSYPKPNGIIWDLLTIDQIERIPILRRLFGSP